MIDFYTGTTYENTTIADIILYTCRMRPPYNITSIIIQRLCIFVRAKHTRTSNRRQTKARFYSPKRASSCQYHQRPTHTFQRTTTHKCTDAHGQSKNNDKRTPRRHSPAIVTTINIGWMRARIRQLYPFPPCRLHVLFNSLFKVLFNFPSRYLFAIGFVAIFSLRWSLPPTLGCVSKQPDSKAKSIERRLE